MICQFSAKNFRCFRDEFTLDMQATPIKECDERVFEDIDGERFLPLAAIYGPNGAGKSTVLDALYSLCLKIMRPICAAKCDNKSCKNRPFCNEQSVIIPIEPFVFSKTSRNSPTEYDLFFRTKNREFHYQLHILRNNIVFEELSSKSLTGNRYSTVFTRVKSNIKLKGSIKRYDVSSISDSLPLLSYLIITHSRNAVLKDIFSWLDNKIDFRNYGLPYEESVISIDDNRKSIVLSMLEEMDIDISNYRVEKTENKIEIYTSHTVGKETTELRIADESSGTIKVFGLLPHLVDSLVNGTTLVVDELDAKLHPFLLQYIIELYTNPKSNKNGAQLIFTSHDLSTMSSEFLRRDEVWYVAKTNEEAAKLYSLVEIARKDAKYDKQYIEGRFGACPYLKRIINWEDVV